MSIHLILNVTNVVLMYEKQEHLWLIQKLWPISLIHVSFFFFLWRFCLVFMLYFISVLFIYFLLYNIVLVLLYIDMNLLWVYMCSPSWILLPPLSLSHSSGSSQCTSPEQSVSCIEPGLVICFTCDNLHVSMSFSHIIQPSPSPTESKRLFYTSVSLLLSLIQVYVTIFLNSIYMCEYTVLVFFFLAYFTLYNRLQFHPPH